MKKTTILSIIAAATLSAQMLPSQVLKNSSLSVENGGVKNAIDAYSDGGGSYVIGDSSTTGKPVDNSPMNELVFKYGESAKTNNTTLVNEVKSLNPDATATDKALADKLNTTPQNSIVNGSPCDDGNTQTINDVYINGVCIGVDGSTWTMNGLPSNVGQRIIPQIVSFNSYLYNANIGLMNYTGLFDGTMIDHWTEKVGYWYFPSDYLEIKVDSTFRIWRSGTTTWSDQNEYMLIQRKDTTNNTYTDVSSYQLQPVRIKQDTWTQFTETMPAGVYRFSTQNTIGHLDSEWYIESIEEL